MKLPAVVLLCCIALYLPAKPNQGAPKNKHNPADDAPCTVTFINDQEAATKTQTAHTSPPRWYTSSEWWLVIIAACTAVFIGLQARETANATKAMRDSIPLQERTASAAQRSADEMRHANEINLESLQAVQRAYVGFPMLDFQTVRVGDETGTPIASQFRLGVENTGNTPALNLIMRVNYWAREGDQGLPGDYDFRDFGPAEDYPMYLSAKAKTYSPVLGIPRDTILGLNERRMRLFFYGWATYRDVFDGTPLHRTEFCHELKVLEIAGDRGIFELSAHREHNSQK